jgi:hypothetical protein
MIEQLLNEILEWWEEAQHEVYYHEEEEYNVFINEPDFVKTAKKMCDELYKSKICDDIYKKL